jgi:phosphate transport system substrate-binding protein
MAVIVYSGFLTHQKILTMKSKMMNKYVFGLALLLVIASCNNTNSQKQNDTSTSGHITVSVDESLKPIIEAQKEVFEALYPDAKLTMVYTNEYDAINMLSNDSARIAIVTRELLQEEKAKFDKRKIVPRNLLIGYDAIGIIVNKNRKDTIFTTSQITNILSGKYTTWKDINPKNKPVALRVVFDHAKSGAIKHLKDSLLNGAPLAKHCYAVNSNPDVIAQVEDDVNTIGIIGTAWISDRDDSTSIDFLNKIIVANLVPKSPETAEASTMKPFQAYVALKQYPLYRKINIINPEGRYGLGTGFASFINSDKGQRIILKSGLVPANVPVRIIKLN